jgi:hypothetical protein
LVGEHLASLGPETICCVSMLLWVIGWLLCGVRCDILPWLAQAHLHGWHRHTSVAANFGDGHSGPVCGLQTCQLRSCATSTGCPALIALPPAGATPVELYFSNGDMLWANEHPRSRLGQARGRPLPLSHWAPVCTPPFSAHEIMHKVPCLVDPLQHQQALRNFV